MIHLMKQELHSFLILLSMMVVALVLGTTTLGFASQHIEQKEQRKEQLQKVIEAKKKKRDSLLAPVTGTFIDKISIRIKYNELRYGIPFGVVATQAALESGWLTSDLCKKNNNIFNIKCKKENCKPGHCIPYFDEVEDSWSNYLVFQDLNEAVDRHAKLLMGKRYENCFSCKEDPLCWFVEIKKAGYATDPDYVKKCSRVYSSNFL